MEDNKQFDHLKDQLNQYDSPIDLDLEWNALSKRKQNKKNRKRIIIFFLFVGLTSIALWLATNQSFDLEKGLAEKSLVEEKSEFEKSDIVNNAVVDQPIIGQADQNESSISEDDLTETNKDTSFNSNQKIDSLNAEIYTPKREGYSPSNSNVEEISPTDSSLIRPIAESQNPQKNQENLTKRKLPILSDLVTLTNRYIYLYSVPPSMSSLVKNDIGVKPSRKPKRFELFLGSGIYQTRQRFKAKSAENDSYRSLRADSEQTKETYFFDIGINFRLNSDLFLSTSLNYAKAFDRLNLIEVNQQAYELTNVPLQIIRYPFGDDMEILGDTTVIGTRTRQVVNYNRYSSVNLSLQLGYQIINRKRLALSVSTGIDWNLNTNVSGKIASPDSDTQILLTDLEQTPVYKSSFGMGLSGGLQASYYFAKSWGLQLRPGFTYYLPSATRSDYVLDANIFRYGMTVGLIKQL